MYLPSQFIRGMSGMLDHEDFEKYMETTELTEKLRRSLYYGKLPTTDRPSLPMTEVAVEFFQDAAPRELGQVDTFIASSYGRRACMSPCAMMLAMLYIKRLKKRNPEYLRNVSSSDLFLISMMMASKYLYDEGVDEEVFNDEWAESANMDLEQLNELERDFLNAIDWNLFVKAEDFWRMLHAVERRIAWEKGREHDAFNYSDLLVLSQDGVLIKTISAVLLELGKVVLVCSVAYVAGVLTIVASTASVLYVRQQLPAPERVSLSIPSAWDATFQWPLIESEDDIGQNKEIFQNDFNAKDGDGSDSSGQQQQNETSILRSSGNVHNAEREPVQQQTSDFRLPGLLTLVMLKNSVLSFASNLGSTLSFGAEHSKENAAKAEIVVNDPDPGHQPARHDVASSDVHCACGCCGHDFGFDKLCYNLSSDSQTKRLWSSDSYGPENMRQPPMTENWGRTDCPQDLDCQCCCAVDQGFWSGSDDSTSQLTRTVPWHRVEEPFAGLTFGFGTSTSVVAAAG